MIKHKLLISLCFLFLLSAILFIYPYNIFHHFTAKERIFNLFKDPLITETLLGESTDITSVKYLGKNIYQIETEVSSYLIIKSENLSTESIDVFKHKQNMRHFRD